MHDPRGSILGPFRMGPQIWRVNTSDSALSDDHAKHGSVHKMSAATGGGGGAAVIRTDLESQVVSVLFLSSLVMSSLTSVAEAIL